MRKFISTIVYFLASIDRGYSSKISFCDGGKLITKTEKDCSYGYNFNRRTPSCVCFEGIYKIWKHNCATENGFAKKICMKIEKSSGIKSLQLSKDPPDWNSFGIVVDIFKNGEHSWSFMPRLSPAPLNVTSFYVVNARVVYEKIGMNVRICVSPARYPPHMRTCYYDRKDEALAWGHKVRTVIFTRQRCVSKHFRPMFPTRCSDVLTEAKSNCSLSCLNNPYKKKKFIPREKKIHLLNTLERKRPQSDKRLSKFQRKKSFYRRAFDIPSNSNYTPSFYRNYENKYFNRKLLMYSVEKELEHFPSGNQSYDLEIKNTTAFEIFDFMKNISASLCPKQYLDPHWIQIGIDLFYILNAESNLQLEMQSYEKHIIYESLYLCSRNLDNIRLFGSAMAQSVSNNSSKEMNNALEKLCSDETNDLADDDTAIGFCKSSNIDEECDREFIWVKKVSLDKFHYVPEIAWKLLDLTHVACFETFEKSFRSFHLLEQSLERLFTQKIKNLWHYPTWQDKIKFKLLGPQADIQMHNFEVCVQAAYRLNPQISRLQRPAPDKYLGRKRRSSRHGMNSIFTPKYFSKQHFGMDCLSHFSSYKIYNTCLKKGKL